MKDKILELRSQGKTYKEICDELGCSKANVSYHCGEGQKEKAIKRQQKYRSESVMSRKVERFRRRDKKIKNRSRDFQRERITKSGKSGRGNYIPTFSWKDVIKKFGWETECYLTGKKIDLKETKSYEFDHIIAVAKGGSNNLDNLGICIKNANRAKSDMSVKELLALCVEILKHHEYIVESPKK